MRQPTEEEEKIVKLSYEIEATLQESLKRCNGSTHELRAIVLAALIRARQIPLDWRLSPEERAE